MTTWFTHSDDEWRAVGDQIAIQLNAGEYEHEPALLRQVAERLAVELTGYDVRKWFLDPAVKRLSLELSERESTVVTRAGAVPSVVGEPLAWLEAGVAEGDCPETDDDLDALIAAAGA